MTTMRFTPARTLPNGELFHSPLGLFPFQADGVADIYLKTEPGTHGGVIAVFDTGIGKTLLGIATATYLFEDDKIDLVIVVAEKNKITDWRDDVERFSALKAHRYHGPGRQKRLAQDDPHVLVTTYETGRTDLMNRQPVQGKRKGRKTDGPLVAALDLRHRRTLWIFDECTKLKGRSSELHQAYDYVLRELRKGPHHHRVLGLTATPMERDFEDSYNLGRIVCPALMPTVADFEATYTRGADDYGRYRFRSDRKEQFARIFQGIILRKRKTDADVIAQFPRQVEKSLHVDLHPRHRDLYDLVANLFDDQSGRTPAQIDADERRLWTALRMTAGHPAAHLRSQSPVSALLTQGLGEDLRKIPSSKSAELIARLTPLVKGQGSQAVVFTFFGNTVLTELAADLRKAGFSVAEFHGRNTLKQNDDAKDRFLRGESQILLTSDAGARGLNLRNAEYVFEYESALTFAMRTQRINRCHRIDSDHPLVTCYTLIAKETLEEDIINLVLKRNEDQDILLGDHESTEENDDHFISADNRRQMLQIARKRKP